MWQLLDEVDVFFSESFCGSSYNAITTLCCRETQAIFKHLWDRRTQRHTLATIKALPEYAQLVSSRVAADVVPLVDKAFAAVLQDLASYNANPQLRPYEVKGNLIAYADGDGFCTSTYFG